MLRAFALALSLVTASATVVPTIARAEAPAEEPVVFPLPKDTERPEPVKGGGDRTKGGGEAKGGGSRIQTYNVPRGRTVVTTEVRAALKKEKWEILKDEPSPSGNATRIQAKKRGQLYKVSFTGDATRTVIILTVP